MISDQLREAMHAAPFRPFLVYLADGRFFLVRHPDFIALAPSGVEATIYDDSGSHVIDLVLVTSVSTPLAPAPAAPPGGDGE